jgi:hypothetical protein
MSMIRMHGASATQLHALPSLSMVKWYHYTNIILMVVYFVGARIFQKYRKHLKFLCAQSVTFQDKALQKIVPSEELWLFLQTTTA